jgi:hypothetical protein
MRSAGCWDAERRLSRPHRDRARRRSTEAPQEGRPFRHGQARRRGRADSNRTHCSRRYVASPRGFSRQAAVSAGPTPANTTVMRSLPRRAFVSGFTGSGSARHRFQGPAPNAPKGITGHGPAAAASVLQSPPGMTPDDPFHAPEGLTPRTLRRCERRSSRRGRRSVLGRKPS